MSCSAAGTSHISDHALPKDERYMLRALIGPPCKVLCLTSRAIPGQNTWMFPYGAEHVRNDMREMYKMMKSKKAK
jgi:hypothetical protein